MFPILRVLRAHRCYFSQGHGLLGRAQALFRVRIAGPASFYEGRANSAQGFWAERMNPKL